MGMVMAFKIMRQMIESEINEKKLEYVSID